MINFNYVNKYSKQATGGLNTKCDLSISLSYLLIQGQDIEDKLMHLEMLALIVGDTFDFTLKFLAELTGEGIDNVWVSTKEIY